MDEPKSKRRATRRECDCENIIITPDIIGDDVAPSTIWTVPKGNQHTFTTFPKHSNIPDHLKEMENQTPADFYNLMVSDVIFQEIADCTNIFAEEKIAKTKDTPRYARIHTWIPTNHSEIKKFFSLVMFMGLVKLSKVADYWSKDEIMSHPFPRKVMSRNRFEILLQMLHFSINDEANKMNRFHFISKLLNKLNEKFKEHYIPDEDLFIQKGPFLVRGIKENAATPKNGTRVLKLCAAPGYVFKVKLFTRKKNEARDVTIFNTVMDLCGDLLNKGHTLYTDDCFTSLDLARKLLDNETHLVGFMRNSKKLLPAEVTAAQLDVGSYIARESHDTITVMKFRNKEEVLLLSTKHSTQFITKQSPHGKFITKPHIINDYEKAKEAVIMCNKMAAISSSLRKSVKWYKRVAIDLLLNTAVLNALTLYKAVTKKSIEIVDFRKQILQHLCQDIEKVPFRSSTKHVLSRKEGPTRKTRRTCHHCYKEKSKEVGRIVAKNRAPKVVTFCNSCPNQPFLCLECFNKTHS